MNPIYTNIIVKQTLSRRFSLSTATQAKKPTKKNSCKETDCCGKPIYVEPTPKIYIERSCQPCSFFTWKPKIPILERAPPLVDGTEKPAKKKHCYAGMQNETKTELKARVAECQKACGVKPVCPVKKPPPKVEKKVECDRSLPIPVADWDMNGREVSLDDSCKK